MSVLKSIRQELVFLFRLNDSALSIAEIINMLCTSGRIKGGHYYNEIAYVSLFFYFLLYVLAVAYL
jgi:hypothetical protein